MPDVVGCCRRTQNDRSVKCTLRDLRGPQTLTKSEFSLLPRKEGRSSRSFLMLLSVRAGHVPAGTAPSVGFLRVHHVLSTGTVVRAEGRCPKEFRVLETERSWPTTWLCTFQNVHRIMRTRTSPVISRHRPSSPIMCFECLFGFTCVYSSWLSASKSTEP